MSITGPADGEPQKVGVALVDVLSGLFATVGILAAVRHRERTDQGQRVEVNLLSSLLAALRLEPIVDVPREAGGTVQPTRNPIFLSGTPPTYRSAPPRLRTGSGLTAAT
jgi:crotonobetainyl-CoA:carnitine CoA-transferase CaiB-like acyl-CoA transferase